MKLDSIRYRLIVLIGLCLLGMLALLTTQVVNVNRLIDVQSDASLLLELNSEILQLRRHEKDFLGRRELHYVSQFDERSEALSNRLSELGRVINDYQLPQSQFENIRGSLAIYQDQFDSLVLLQTAIGLDEETGLQGKFRDSIHLLEQSLKSNNDSESLLVLLQLRRSEKDFLQRLDLDYSLQAQANYELLKIHFGESSQTANETLLDTYYREFSQLIISYEQMGLSPETGIQGELRAAAHSLEQQLEDLSLTLNPLLAERERDVKLYGFAIATLTVSILLALLVRNFIRLQKTLSTFLLFFHQSKREYQPLDTKKMAFSEFRVLAEVANEMVDARRDMETELKESKAEIKTLKTKIKTLEESED